MGFFDSISNFFAGTPEKRENVSTLRKSQDPLYRQLQSAGRGQGAGGAFGQSADYYRDLLSDNPEDMQSFAAPQMRQFNEEIIPDLAEQFAGMGSGGLSSSGFRNSSTQAGAGLAERLGAIRANLRQTGAQGLSNIGQMGLGNFSQNMTTQQGSPGFLSQVAPAVGTGIGMAFGGPLGAAAGNWAGNMVGKNTSPYGQQPGGINSR